MMMMMQMGVRFTAEVTTWMPSAMPKLAKYLVAIACGCCSSAHKLVKLFQLGETCRRTTSSHVSECIIIEASLADEINPHNIDTWQ